MNKVILMGRLTADPELRQTNSGVNTCRITVAVDRRVPQGAEKQADFITVIAWNQQAEFVSRYFSKGRMIAVEGNLRTGSYDDKRYPDVKHYTTEVWADRIEFCGDKPQNGTVNTGVEYSSAQQPQQYNKPPQQYNKPPQQNAPAYNAGNNDISMSIGDFGDFEDVISDSELPF